MTAAELANAVAGMARVMSRDRYAHEDLAPSFLLLTETLADVVGSNGAETRTEVSQGTVSFGTNTRARAMDANAHRLAARWPFLKDVDPGERIEIVMDRFGWSKATYHRARARAQELGLLGQSHQSHLSASE